MVIDFHTHVFPDKIAKKTIDFLAEKSGNEPFSDGTVFGLYNRLLGGCVDVAVALPVLTKPEQFESVLSFVVALNETYSKGDKKIISFGGIHPRCDDIRGKLKRVKELGLKGVKIHPDYQDTFIDDDGYLEILKCAKDLDLIVVTHAGVDAGYRDKAVKCPPILARKVIDKIGHEKFVLAHFGGNEQTSEVLEHLAGQKVYFDTAYLLKTLCKKDFVSVLNKHGEDRILFASDFPWSDFDSDVEVIKSYGLGAEIQEKILYKNAERLLCIKS